MNITHDSANPPRKSLSGHSFVWLSKTDKEFSFCAPERLCPLRYSFKQVQTQRDELAGYALKTT